MFIKVLKKIEVYDFRLKIFWNFCRTRSIFWTVIQDMPKMTLLPWAQHHSWKSQEVWEHLDHSLRNGSRSPERRVDSPPPPHLLRLKILKQIIGSKPSTWHFSFNHRHYDLCHSHQNKNANIYRVYHMYWNDFRKL